MSQASEFEGKIIMDKINAKTSNGNDNLANSILGSVKRAMAMEYDREMAEKLLAGDGFFLDLEQLAAVRENLAKVRAMARLVASNAWENRDNTEFVMDIYAAMSLALQELEKVEQMISENIPSSSCRDLDSSECESGK
jgi:hypothetical protein